VETPETNKPEKPKRSRKPKPKPKPTNDNDQGGSGEAGTKDDGNNGATEAAE